MINKFKEKLRHHFHEIHKPEISEHSIALGFAIGTFIGILLPVPVFSIPAALLVILVNKKISKLALFGAIILFWNFLTLTPVYLLSYEIGKLLFGEVSVVKFDIVILDKIYNSSIKYLRFVFNSGAPPVNSISLISKFINLFITLLAVSSVMFLSPEGDASM